MPASLVQIKNKSACLRVLTQKQTAKANAGEKQKVSGYLYCSGGKKRCLKLNK